MGYIDPEKVSLVVLVLAVILVVSELIIDHRKSHGEDDDE